MLVSSISCDHDRPEWAVCLWIHQVSWAISETAWSISQSLSVSSLHDISLFKSSLANQMPQEQIWFSKEQVPLSWAPFQPLLPLDAPTAGVAETVRHVQWLVTHPGSLVCMCLCVCVYTHTYIYICTHICICTYIYTHMYTYIYGCLYS